MNCAECVAIDEELIAFMRQRQRATIRVRLLELHGKGYRFRLAHLEHWPSRRLQWCCSVTHPSGLLDTVWRDDRIDCLSQMLQRLAS